MKFERKGKRVFIILIYVLVFVLHGKAQTNMVFYPIENQFNSPNLNPAFLTSQSKYTLGIFPLSGINLGYNNQLVIKNMLINILHGNNTNDDFREVFSSMVKLDLFYQRTETNLITLGYNSDLGSFDFHVKENIQLMTDIKGEFSEFLTNNSSQTILINKSQTFPALALHYREYSLGYAKEIIKKKLSVGVRAKVYFGKSSMASEVNGVVVQRDQNIYLQTHDKLKLSVPIHIVPDADSLLRTVTLDDNFTFGDYLMNSKNIGVGFDLGFNYKLTPDLVLSASVIDVGSIKWNNNLNTMIFKGEYQFPHNFIVASDNGVLTRNQDFSSETVDFPELYKVKIDKLPYSTRLPVTFYTGLKYRLDPRLNINLVNRYISTQTMSFNSLTVTGIYDIKKNLMISTGYSIIGKSYSNIPFAILYTCDTGQYYFGTDNLLSIIAPSTAEFSGITFGMCFFLFKNKSKYKTQPEYLPFYKEKKTISVNRNGLIKGNAHE